MKTAVYMRVSTENQSIEMQEREISMFLESKGIKDVVIYKDEGESGISTSRPALNRLENDIKHGAIKTLIVWKLDRLFRSLVELDTHLKAFHKLGIIFISIKDNIDLSNPTGILMMQILGAFAEFEREMIITRVKAGLANAKAKGKRLGAPQKLKPDLIQYVLSLLENQDLKYREVADKAGITISTVQYIETTYNKNLAKVS